MPVTRPTQSDVHVVQPLNNYSEKWLQDQDMFVSMRALPLLPVSKQADSYYQFSREDFFRDEAKERADGTESAGGGFGLSTDTYNCRVYSFHKDVTDRQRANQDNQVRLEQSATQYVMQKMMLARERLFANTLLATSVWSNEDLTSVDWGGSGTPIVDIRAAKQSVHSATGMRPNKLIVGRATWDGLLDNAEVLDRIVGGSTSEMPAQVQRRLLAQILELDEIHVADSVVNSAIRGATESTDFLVNDIALLYFAPDSPSLDSPTAAQQFAWTGLLGSAASGQAISRFRMQNLKADRIEAEMAFDYKVTAPELGFFWSNTIA